MNWFSMLLSVARILKCWACSNQDNCFQKSRLLVSIVKSDKKEGVQITLYKEDVQITLYKEDVQITLYKEGVQITLYKEGVQITVYADNFLWLN